MSIQNKNSIDNFSLDGLTLAKHYKYYSQFKNPYIVHVQPIQKMAAKTCYKNHKKTFDNLSLICSRNHVNASEYIQHVVDAIGVHDHDLDEKLLCSASFLSYVNSLETKQKRKKIYRSFVKSAEFVSSECAKLGFLTTIDYFRHIIFKKKLAAYYMSGKLSKHFLSGIPKFPALVQKLDQISKDEFHEICSMYDIYSLELKEALQQERALETNSIRFTDDLIFNQKAHFKV